MRAANEHMGGDALVRRQLCVFWSRFGDSPDNKTEPPNAWRSATIRRIDKVTGACEIKYHDDRRKRSQAYLYLPLTIVHFARCPPSPGAAPRSVADGQWPLPPLLPLLPPPPPHQPQLPQQPEEQQPPLVPRQSAALMLAVSASTPPATPSLSPTTPAPTAAVHGTHPSFSSSSSSSSSPAAAGSTSPVSDELLTGFNGRGLPGPAGARVCCPLELPAGFTAAEAPTHGSCSPTQLSWPLVTPRDDSNPEPALQACLSAPLVAGSARAVSPCCSAPEPPAKRSRDTYALPYCVSGAAATAITAGLDASAIDPAAAARKMQRTGGASALVLPAAAAAVATAATAPSPAGALSSPAPPWPRPASHHQEPHHDGNGTAPWGAQTLSSGSGSGDASRPAKALPLYWPPTNGLALLRMLDRMDNMAGKAPASDAALAATLPPSTSSEPGPLQWEADVAAAAGACGRAAPTAAAASALLWPGATAQSGAQPALPLLLQQQQQQQEQKPQAVDQVSPFTAASLPSVAASAASAAATAFTAVGAVSGTAAWDAAAVSGAGSTAYWSTGLNCGSSSSTSAAASVGCEALPPLMSYCYEALEPATCGVGPASCIKGAASGDGSSNGSSPTAAGATVPAVPCAPFFPFGRPSVNSAMVAGLAPHSGGGGGGGSYGRSDTSSGSVNGDSSHHFAHLNPSPTPIPGSAWLCLPPEINSTAAALPRMMTVAEAEAANPSSAAATDVAVAAVTAPVPLGIVAAGAASAAALPPPAAPTAAAPWAAAATDAELDALLASSLDFFEGSGALEVLLQPPAGSGAAAEAPRTEEQASSDGGGGSAGPCFVGGAADRADGGGVLGGAQDRRGGGVLGVAVGAFGVLDAAVGFDDCLGSGASNTGSGGTGSGGTGSGGTGSGGTGSGGTGSGGTGSSGTGSSGTGNYSSSQSLPSFGGCPMGFTQEGEMRLRRLLSGLERQQGLRRAGAQADPGEAVAATTATATTATAAAAGGARIKHEGEEKGKVMDWAAVCRALPVPSMDCLGFV